MKRFIGKGSDQNKFCNQNELIHLNWNAGDRRMSFALRPTRGVRFLQRRQGLQCHAAYHLRRLEEDPSDGRAPPPRHLHPRSGSFPRNGAFRRRNTKKATTLSPFIRSHRIFFFKIVVGLFNDASIGETKDMSQYFKSKLRKSKTKKQNKKISVIYLYFFSSLISF